LPTSAPTASAPAIDRVNGFDADQVYAKCIELDPGNWGNAAAPSPSPRAADSVQPATGHDYVEGALHDDPNAIIVVVNYKLESITVGNLCVASGDPSSPLVEYIRSID
jgi:hypothetical protein